MQSCSNTYSDFLVNCGYFIKLNAVFTPTTGYTWNITDKHGNEYTGSVTTDEDGQFYIPVGDLPEGLLTPYSGTFVLRVQDTECQWLPLRMMKVYDGVEFYVKGGDRGKESLGCEVDCEISGTPSNSAAYERLLNLTTTIDWDLEQRTLYGNTPTVQVYRELSTGVWQLDPLVQVVYNAVDTILQSLDITAADPGNYLIIVRG